MAKKNAIKQPPFDSRIYKLVYPLQGGRAPGQGTLQHGFMVWEKPLVGYGDLAKVHFLYNPSVVEADFPISDSTAQAVLQFPDPNDKANLRVPLSQTASWSLLYDRTYELWGSFDPQGKPRHSAGKENNDPRVVGVLADIIQMQQFTGMMVGFSPGTTPTPAGTKGFATFAGHQGIIQIVPSYVYFSRSSKNTPGLSFYGYISEWDVQVTHWSNFMVPMRCVINITFTLLPPVQSTPNPSSTDLNFVTNLFRFHGSPGAGAATNVPAAAGVAGR